MSYVSGSAGLWSTVDDYARFARMFVNEGAVDGVRLLKIGTLRRMMSDFLSDEQRASARIMGGPVFSAHGFGLGVAVVLDPERADVTRCRGGVGTVGWPGAFGGWWQADPTDGTVMVFLAHNGLNFERMAQGHGLGVFAAIEHFHGLA
jgi:CubicO group peptidase (beta-lactamase class C family)